jgi:hypothetical protein
LKTILIFPLSNVLGHLARSLALAEAFDVRGDQVHVVLSRAHGYVRKVLPARIRVLPSPEMPPVRMGPSGLLADYQDGVASDRANLARSSALSVADQRRRSQRLTQMLERDAAIIGQVRPDAIIADQRVTPALLPRVGGERLFHVSNILGYPSFFQRLSGALPFPLETGRVLVPGVAEIEYAGEPAVSGRGGTPCGPFRWEGWRRLNSSAAVPPPSDVFLTFGSTGNGRRITPWLLDHLPSRYRVSAIASETPSVAARPDAYVTPRGDLGSFLARTTVAFCHGGHGTVMECILHRVPMVILPQNIEQLEIGRRIERLGMGILVKRPYDQLTPSALGEMVESLKTDDEVRTNLDRYARLLQAQDGAFGAVSIVHRGLAET